MAKKSYRSDFDDLDTFGTNQAGYGMTPEKKDLEEDPDDWAGVSRRRKPARKPILPAVLAAIVMLSLVLIWGRKPQQMQYPADTLPEETQLWNPPVEQTQIPQASEPLLPPEIETTVPNVEETWLPPEIETTVPNVEETWLPPETQTVETEPVIPEFTESQATGVQLMLELEAQILEDKYGVTILVGDQCDMEFSHFTATRTQDYEKVIGVLEMLDYVLGRYPEGFFRQLCTEARSGVEIHLIQNLWANNGDLQGNQYAGFSQDVLDHYIMVVDIDDSYEELYYHEFSHIIDAHLALDAARRPDALFSEETWASYNPSWFPGYSQNYMNMPELLESGWFVDSYGAVNPSEDRAQVMGKAMLKDYRIYFKNNYGIRMKMEYYSACIRDAFDTSAWPEILPWEENYR